MKLLVNILQCNISCWVF